MVGCRVALLALVFACSGEPQADVRWLINENSEEVMGLVGRGAAAGSIRAQRFVLLECASYDLFAAASEAYQRHAAQGAKDEQPPRGCKELVTTELSREQLKASKQEVVAQLKKEKLVDSLLAELSNGLRSGAVFAVIGISVRHTKFLAKVVDKLKILNILPQIPAQGKIKKGLVMLSTVVMLVTSSDLLQRKGHEHYQIMLSELSGVGYSHHLQQDREASQESYAAIKQLLTALVEEKGSKKVLPALAKVANKLPRVVAH